MSARKLNLVRKDNKKMYSLTILYDYIYPAWIPLISFISFLRMHTLH